MQKFLRTYYPFEKYKLLITVVTPLTLNELVSFNGERNYVYLRRLVGLLTLFFLTIHAAGQLKAGGKALEIALGQPDYVGILMIAIIVVFYCWSGGIRASIWTDSVQIIIMTLGIVVIMVAAVIDVGGIGALYADFMASAPPGSDELDLFPQNLSVIGGSFGLLFMVLSGFGIGISVMGQPHVTNRPMALKNAKDAKKFIIFNTTFEVLFSKLCFIAGLSTRAILKDTVVPDPELCLFLAAVKLLPPIAVGLFLASIFSAVLSTVDSQVISCSGCISRDIPRVPKRSLLWAKGGHYRHCCRGNFLGPLRRR